MCCACRRCCSVVWKWRSRAAERRLSAETKSKPQHARRSVDVTKHAGVFSTTPVQLEFDNSSSCVSHSVHLPKVTENTKTPSLQVPRNQASLHTYLRRTSASDETFPRLHISPTRHSDSLPINITHQRTGHRQNRARCLRRRSWPSQRDIQMLLALRSGLLRLRYSQRNLLPIRRRHECTRLLRSRQSREDMSKGDRVGADTEGWTPSVRKSAGISIRRGANNILLCNRLRHARNSRLCKCIVNLPRVSIQTARTANINDIPRLAILDPKVRRRSAHNLERRGSVQVDNGMPLLVRHLVDDAVPCVARVVDDDVDLAVAEVCGVFDELGDVGVVHHVAHDSDGGAARCVDAVDDSFSLF